MNQKTVALFLFSILLSSCSSSAYLAQKQRSNQKEELIDFAQKFLHTPYRYGGSTPRGFDCSGYTQYIYQQFGYLLQRTTRQQAQQVTKRAKKELEVGDLVFFGGRRQRNSINHVGIVTQVYAPHNFDFIHASTSSGVIISNSQEKYYADRYIKAGKIEPQRVAKKSKKETTHIVKPKETLYRISRLYGCTVAQLIQWNNLQNHTIRIGQALIIKSSKK